MCGATEQGHARNNGAATNLSSDTLVNLDQYVLFLCIFVFLQILRCCLLVFELIFVDYVKKI